ncbi:MAG: SDR family NAD(P)-dependent oxidoreductase [Erysipelotrichaceae bacterium]
MKTILITGATDGLGKAIALQLSQKNYKLILTGRNQEKMNQLLSLIPNELVVYHQCFDMLEQASIYAFNEKIKNIKVDILINNAGANLKKEKVEALSYKNMVDMMQLNCFAHVMMIQGVYPQMKQRQEGHIINVLSSCCKFDNETMAGYTASKQAMDAVSHILTKEARNDHIKVSSVYPGGIDTPFRSIANHNYLKPETVATAIIQCIELPEEANMHEIVLRPLCESNF